MKRTSPPYFSNTFWSEDETVPIACTTAGGRQCRTDEDFAKEGNRYYIDKAYKEDGAESSFLVTKLLKKLTDEIEFAKEALKPKPKDFGISSKCSTRTPFKPRFPTRGGSSTTTLLAPWRVSRLPAVRCS